MPIETLCLDADDTLWHNDTLFAFSRQRFLALLEGYASPDHLEERLLAADIRNLKFYGYGVKGFTLSMIETALEVMDKNAPVSIVGEILEAGKSILGRPVEPLEGVRETLKILSQSYRLVLITKGDLLDQEQKLASSGMGDFFDAVEIVSSKDIATYTRLFARHGHAAASAMVGNSLHSDVLPAIAAGGWGVHIPYVVASVIDRADEPEDRSRYVCLQAMTALPGWLATVR